MTSLAGVELDANLQLVGLETNADIAFSVRDLLGGPSVVQMDKRDSGAELKLRAINTGSRRMGYYCSWQIDLLKVICAAGKPVPLVHIQGNYIVYILSFDVIQSDEKVVPGPNKKFHGDINIQEI